MPPRRQQKGSTLGTVILVVLLLVIFGATLVNLAVFDLRTVARNGQKQLAFNAAESGLETVIAMLAADPQAGTRNEVFTETLPDGSSYRVSFDSSQPGSWSLNNMGSLSDESGYNGRVVPALHASLFSEGRSPTGETSLVECLIRLEAIPYTVAGSAQVDLRTTTIVGTSLTEPSEAHVYSGASGPGSLTLEGVTTLSGDARSVGQVDTNPLATVSGDIEENRSPETLPNLNIDLFSTEDTKDVKTETGGVLGTGVLEDTVLTDVYYLKGDRTFNAVTLLDATVFIEGNLTVTTALAGTGTIFVTGETRFDSSINVLGGDRLTFFSDGDVTFSPLGGVLTGVIFSKGNVVSPGPLTVMGAVYAVNDSDPTRGNVEIGSLLLPSTVIHDKDSTAFASFWLGHSGDADAIRVYWRNIH